MRTLLILVAALALLLKLGLEPFDPVRRWRNAILDDNNGARRWDAVYQASVGKWAGVDNDTAVQLLADALLEDPSARVRQTAVGAITRFRPRSRRALWALCKALHDTDFGVRIGAASGLSEIPVDPADPDRAEMISALTEALQDRNRDVRFSAAIALARHGSETDVVPKLIEILKTRNVGYSGQALWALKSVPKSSARRAVPELLKLAECAKPSTGEIPLRYVGVYAAELLLELGEEGRAIEILREAQRSPDLAGEASRILGRLSQKSAGN